MLYAECMSEANLRESAQAPAFSKPLAAAASAVLFAGAFGLWWRFGEGVFAQSLMNAIIACF
jgi:hypothetical protein